MLGLETIDVMHLHGVTPSDYDRVIDGCLPLLQRAQREGKIRSVGSARSVLPKAKEKGVATLIMFAVRKVFSDRVLLKEICSRLVASGEIFAGEIDLEDPLGFLVRGGDAQTLIEAAYRYCRHLAGPSVVLTGTSQSEHLVENIASIEGAPLSNESLRMIDAMFHHVVSVTGEKWSEKRSDARFYGRGR